MVTRTLVASFILSLVSLLVVLYTPLDIEIRESGRMYSPYRAELDELHAQAKIGISTSELEHLESLIEKNNRWFKEEKQNQIKFSATSALKAWRKKSTFIAPAIMLLWSFAFYYFFRKKPCKHAIYILVFPIVLFLTGLMPFLELILISLAVLSIWFWWLIRGQIE